MRKQLLLFTVILLSASTLFAQEKTEVSVKITKNGKTVKDTTYSFSSMDEADQAVKMMELSGDDHIYVFNSKKDSEGNMKVMTFSGDDKDMHFISEDLDSICKGDHMTWYTMQTGKDGDSVKVIKIKCKGEAHSGAHVYVKGNDSEEVYCMNSTDGKTTIMVSGKDGDDVKVISKKMVLINGDEGEWTVEEGEDGEIIMISEDGKVKKINTQEIKENEGDATWHIKKGDNEEEMIIIKKKKSTGEDDAKVEVLIEEKVEKKKKN